MVAYWEESAEIGDIDVIRQLAAEVGVSSAGVEDALAKRDFGRVVDASRTAAVTAGIDGIPAFLIDRRVLLVGAQPHEAFERAFEQAATM